jgi:hypothetical protein
MLTLTLVFSLLSVNSIQILLVGGLLASLLRYFELFDSSSSVLDQGEVSHCFLKAKNFVAWLDEAYIYPFFVSEQCPSALASPKFHNESKREAGIELKGDEAGSLREIEALA